MLPRDGVQGPAQLKEAPMFGRHHKREQAPQPVPQPDPIRADLLRRMQTTWNGPAGLKLQQELAQYDAKKGGPR